MCLFVCAHAHDAYNLYFRSLLFNPLAGVTHYIIIIIVCGRTAGTQLYRIRDPIHRFISFAFITLYIRFPAHTSQNARPRIRRRVYVHCFCRRNGNDRDLTLCSNTLPFSGHTRRTMYIISLSLVVNKETEVF